MRYAIALLLTAATACTAANPAFEEPASAVAPQAAVSFAPDLGAEDLPHRRPASDVEPPVAPPDQLQPPDLGCFGGCKACGCPELPHAVSQCASRCAILRCEPGFFDCNLDPADGCEVNGGEDSENCGACGKACGEGTACCGFQCVYEAVDPDNCGACGRRCLLPTPSCAGGQCL